MYLLLENVNNVNRRAETSVLGISNPRIEDGGIPQGLDDPLETSNVSFNDDVIIHHFSEYDRRLRDYFTVCSFGDTSCLQFLPYSVVESYFYIYSRRFVPLPVLYEAQSGVDLPTEFPQQCYLASGELVPGVADLWLQGRLAYIAYWAEPRGDSPSSDFFAPCVKLAESFKAGSLQGEPGKPVKPPPNGPEKPGKPPAAPPFVPQSGELVDNSVASDTVVKPLTLFSDDTADVEAQFRQARDDTYYVADTADTDIARFFQRPVNIGTYSWRIGTPFPEVLLVPASVFFANKKVVNRIAHNALLKADMCVKIMVNGTPFHYGTILASVHINRSTDQTALAPGGPDANNISHSQRPHVYLDPTTSQGGCLRLPFIDQRNAWDIPLASVFASSTLHLREIVPLRHVSGIVENITITVVAWAENVVLSGPTLKAPLVLVPQSGDEFGEGVVSRPALILSHAAGIAGRSPWLAPYAMPFQLGAKAMGELARLFGFSKPNVVGDMIFMNPRENPPFSSVVAHDPIFKSTFDDKSQVTVDPRVVGAQGEDEMTIASIVTRESYLTQFPMTQLAIPGTRLFQVGVGPTLFQTVGTPANLIYHMTPMCWASLPFKHWRGTLRYRFRAVTSSFHRGRVRIVYEPTNVAATLGSNTMPDYNVQHTYVWDLSESKEAVIDVGWHNRRPYLDVDDITFSAATTFPFVANPAVAGNLNLPEDRYNGTLSIVVMNELTAPSVNLNADISIIVSVCALDDFEVFNPTPTVIDRFQYSAQSGELMEDTRFLPVATKSHVLFGKTLHGSKSPVIHHGDSVTSIRALVKRYAHTVTMAIPNTANDVKVTCPAFPLYPGKTPGAVHLAGAIAYNYTSQNALTWFTPAFVARRGGLRMRFMPLSPTQRNAVISRAVGVGFGIVPVVPSNITPSVVAKYNMDVRLRNIAGWSGTNYQSSPEGILDLEVPYHSPYRYSNARALDHLNSTMAVQCVQISTRDLGNAIHTVGYDVYVSAADDFSLSIFAAVPPMSRVVAIP